MFCETLCGFVLPSVITLATIICDENNNTKSTERKSYSKPVRKIKKKKEDHPHYSEDIPTSLFNDNNDENDDADDDIDDEDDIDHNILSMINHLKRFLELMDIIDDGLDAAVKEDPSGEPVYEKFGNYYRTIIPYLDIIGITYQHTFASELKPAVEKFTTITNKFIDEFIGDIYDSESVDIGVELKYELDEINKLAKIRIEEGVGRPSFDSIINNIDNTLDET